MRPRIAIPLPHSLDREYAERAIPQYEHAVEQMGGEPVRLGMDLSSELKKHELKNIVEGCDGILLPGSKADVDPAKFKAPRSSHSASADNQREAGDELLLEHAYQSGKPVLGICYGLQSLNVFRGGSLIQHIPDFLPEDLRTRVNHEAGRKIAVAHEVTIEDNSRLAEILCRESRLGTSGGPALK
ncbi:MAG: gamma-glutamyl-gamma-aminobutyrate hydrolase family protein, partial [Candidatus Sulfotelmatobacter sp.]